MAGGGGYVGAGVLDAPLQSGLSTSRTWYAEVDAGWGPTVGGSLQGTTPPGQGKDFFNSPPAGGSVGLPVSGKFFVGGGVWGGVGVTGTATLSTPTLGSLF